MKKPQLRLSGRARPFNTPEPVSMTFPLLVKLFCTHVTYQILISYFINSISEIEIENNILKINQYYELTIKNENNTKSLLNGLVTVCLGLCSSNRCTIESTPLPIWRTAWTVLAQLWRWRWVAETPQTRTVSPEHIRSTNVNPRSFLWYAL